MGNSICVSKKNAGDRDDMPSLSKKKSSAKNKSKDIVKNVEPEQEEVIVKKSNEVQCASYDDPALRAPKDFSPRMAEPFDETISEEEMPKDNFNQLKPSKDLDDDQRNLILNMDEGTLDVSKRNQKRFLDLIWQLIYSRDLTSDLDIVRAIFLWLVTKNLNEMEFEQPTHGSPEEMLMKIKNREITYAEVFAILCQYAGIKCKVINGYAKGVEFVPGMKLNRNTQALHSWNAAYVDKCWYLFDCHWAARRLIATEPTMDNLFSTVDDFYYKANPNHLKMTHYPFEEKWQLTNAPISLEEFEKFCPVKSSFYKYELDLLNRPNGYIEHSSKKPLRLKIGYPSHLLHHISFTFSLRQEVIGEIYKTEDLSNYAIHFTASTDPPIHAFVFRFPRTGTYNILLYVRDLSSETFSIFCEYRVEAKVPKSETGYIPIPFPSTQQNQYGPTEVASEMCVSVAEPTKCVFEDVKQYKDIYFRTTKSGVEMPTMVAQLRGMDIDENKLSRFVLQRIVPASSVTPPLMNGPATVLVSKQSGAALTKGMEQNMLVITPFLPMVGEYSLEIYAEDKDKESNKYHLMWQFLLKTNTVHDFGPLPMLPGNILGPQSEFFELGLRLLSHPDPFVRIPALESTEENQQQRTDITVNILLPPKDATTGYPTVRVIAHLCTNNEDGEEEDMTDYVLQQLDEQILALQIRFPKSGLYKMHIYGHALPDVNDTLPVLCTYLFYVMPRLPSIELPFRGSLFGPYPKQTNKWREGAKLNEPLKGLLTKKDLTLDRRLKFNLDVPRAKDVVIILDGEEVSQLKHVQVDGKDLSEWEGDVTIPFVGEHKICVAGRWTTVVGNYPALLEYKIVMNN